MTTRLTNRLAVFAPLLLALAAGSSSAKSAKSTSTAPPTTAAGALTTTTAPALTGSLNVFAAASLTAAFNAAKTTFASADPGLNLTLNLAGSNTLVAQIQQGAPADVFASADQANMTKLVTAGLVDTPVTFAKNKLEIAVAPGNPKQITSLQDLAKQ